MKTRTQFLLAISLIAGLPIMHGREERRGVVDPVDNVKLLWVDKQASRYEYAMQAACSMSDALSKANQTASCTENKMQSTSWNRKREVVYDFLENKYGTRYFTFDEENGTAKPYFGALR